MANNFNDWVRVEGSINQSEYVKRSLVLFIGAVVLGIIPGIGWLIGLAAGVLGVFASIRRLNTIRKSPWLCLLFLVPVIGLIFWIWLLLQK